MNRAEAHSWLCLFGDLEDSQRRECRHGHPECSTTNRGECLDDVIQIACCVNEENEENEDGE